MTNDIEMGEIEREPQKADPWEISEEEEQKYQRDDAVENIPDLYSTLYPTPPYACKAPTLPYMCVAAIGAAAVFAMIKYLSPPRRKRSIMEKIFG